MSKTQEFTSALRLLSDALYWDENVGREGALTIQYFDQIESGDPRVEESMHRISSVVIQELLSLKESHV
jgi:hypothetical protein